MKLVAITASALPNLAFWQFIVRFFSEFLVARLTAKNDFNHDGGSTALVF